MVFPVYDEDHEAAYRPWVTWSLVGSNTLVAILLQILPFEIDLGFVYHFGLTPAFVSGASSAIGLVIAPIFTFLTYGFLHIEWLHLAANMLILWVFGDNVEKSTGHFRFLIFYFLCQIAGGIAHVLSDPSSQAPAIGASGAISGVLAAYLLIRPHARIVMLILGVMTINVRAYLVILAWAAWQIVSFLFGENRSNIAFWAHIAGFVTGAALIVLMRQPDVTILGYARPFDALRKYLTLIARRVRRQHGKIT